MIKMIIHSYNVDLLYYAKVLNTLIIFIFCLQGVWLSFLKWFWATVSFLKVFFLWTLAPVFSQFFVPDCFQRMFLLFVKPLNTGLQIIWEQKRDELVFCLHITDKLAKKPF